MSQNLIVAGVGEVLWDLYPDKRYVGGAIANVIRHVARLGIEAVLISAVGADSDGNALREEMNLFGLTTNFIQEHPDVQTGSVGIRVDSKGIPEYRCSVDAAFDHLVWKEPMGRLARRTDAVVVGTLAQRHPESRKVIEKFLRDTDASIFFDVNFRDLDAKTLSIVKETLKRAMFLKLNIRELDLLRSLSAHPSERIVHFLESLLSEYCLRAVIVTLGTGGCFVMEETESFISFGIEVNPRDTTGCGDAFTAAFLVSWLNGESMQISAQKANALGAMVAMKTGAVPDYSVGDFERTCEEAESRMQTERISVENELWLEEAASSVKGDFH